MTSSSRPFSTIKRWGDVADGREVGRCTTAGGQGSVPLFAQLFHFGIPSGCQAKAVAGTGTEFVDAQRMELSPRLIKIST
ncbi:hypothetical protein [Streptomyces sp. NPDC058307]|uniref:hypothetical protein n=1 Tax=Streptomyces sp. NPDC058307 TaxID=3346439 RepID=UPI0036E26449